MGWGYILINHTRGIIMETSLQGVWHLMRHLIRKQGWEEGDDVEMMYEENNWTEIGKMVVEEGYKSHYNISDFDRL